MKRAQAGQMTESKKSKKFLFNWRIIYHGMCKQIKQIPRVKIRL